jgi:hypothetical protein
MPKKLVLVKCVVPCRKKIKHAGELRVIVLIEED